MLGTERFLYDMAANPEIVHAIIRRMTAFYLELNSRFFSALKNKIDIHFWGNDFGTQKGLLISVQMWRDFYEESYRRLIELAHSFGLKVMIHSCGAVRDLLPVFSELGIDILDPVQTGAAGMEPEGLKRDFGEQLIFHGGIDTQKVLPNGREDEVKSHVREMIDILGRSGGYICCSSNNIQTDTPVKNVTAMYEEIIR
jgi:uroporphyrinogen decarboxylase